MQLVPLVWAHTNGIRVLGVELDVSSAHRYTLARRWADALVPGAAVVTFMAGRAGDLYAYAAPVAIHPPANLVATSLSARRRLRRAGVAFAWLSIAALVGEPLHEAAAHAMAFCSSLRGETAYYLMLRCLARGAHSAWASLGCAA